MPKKNRIGCFYSKIFSASVIALVPDLVDLLTGDVCKLASLGYVLAHEAIGIFIHATLHEA